MLNKFLAILVILASFNVHAQEFDTSKAIKAIELIPENVKIREPFTALATVNLSIKNNTNNDLKIKRVYTSHARHTDIYEKYVSDIGSEQRKRAKNVYIKANQTTEFSNTSDFQIMLTGLKRKYEVGEEIELHVETVHDGNFRTYLPVHASYK